MASKSFRAIIKGTPFEARFAAVSHGITMHAVDTCNGYNHRANHTVLFVNAQHEAALVAWFCENSELKPGTGYVAGTCLFYSENH